MKAIQVTLDEGLLEQMDADEEVRRDGRSAVLRRAVRMYLAARRTRQIANAYRAAYRTPGLGADFAGWEDESAWPEP